jgi:hypothetical protein
MIYTLSMATISYRNWEKMISFMYHNVVISLRVLNLWFKEIFLPQNQSKAYRTSVSECGIAIKKGPGL